MLMPPRQNYYRDDIARSERALDDEDDQRGAAAHGNQPASCADPPAPKQLRRAAGRQGLGMSAASGSASAADQHSSATSEHAAEREREELVSQLDRLFNSDGQPHPIDFDRDLE
jgi:hypothetical protein